MNKQENNTLWLTVFFGFAVFFLFFGLGTPVLVDWDENIYAEASKQMLLRGDYLNVYINGQPFAEKPPFYFWEQVLSYHVWGVNEFGARFPSALAGLMTLAVMVFTGSKLISLRFGLLWGVVYLTSLLPAILSRSAVIDHTFNFLITIAAFSLYGYDLEYQKKLTQEHTKTKHWLLLTVASVAMGLAVLTKGPLGGVIPLVAFGGYKTWQRFKNISIGHFLYCAVLSLGIASSWYLANWWVHGLEFLKNFIAFQSGLFSKPLEGHTGPFFYHWIVALFGIFPWTGFLFQIRRHKMEQLQPTHARPLLVFSLSWCVFVLVLFSLVSTKLPHYSASIYVPLSLLIAWSLYHIIHHENGIVPKFILIIHGVLIAGFAAGFWYMPYGLRQFVHESYPDWPIQWGDEWSLIVAGFGGLAGAGWWFLLKKQPWKFVGFTALSMLFCSIGIWRYQVPTYQQFLQNPLVELVRQSQSEGAQVVFYRFVSFAAIHYSEEPIVILHNYKFEGNPEILDQSSSEKLVVIAESRETSRLLREHPGIMHVRDFGPYAIFERSALNQPNGAIPAFP
ncbi:MAG: glycosyltransferase family 39 protein, partial [SAR324 cluster bacterium]|nr:glycosyltransferase family 39 protein [SAR324 cluster bacterium]